MTSLGKKENLPKYKLKRTSLNERKIDSKNLLTFCIFVGLLLLRWFRNHLS